jgi:dimethylamine monooxygenase subunit C
MTTPAHTSVPLWALPPGQGGATPVGPATDGAAYVLLGIGPGAVAALDRWEDELRSASGRPGVRRLAVADAEEAARALADTLASARVGVRLRVAGPVAGCLAVRAAAVAAGIEDDELHLAPTVQGALDLFCVHCAAVTSVEAAIGAVAPCAGCGKNLLVYHHVARRTGQFLGFQIDAEEAS